MKRLSLLLAALLLGLGSSNILAAGDAKVGQSKSVFCATCHGTTGKTALPKFTGGYTNLAGMDPAQFVAAMKAYRSAQRIHPLMQFFVLPASDQDIEDLAAYYASMGPTLYERLGGKDAINAVVKDLLAAGLVDPRLNPRMSKLDGAKCERQLTDLLCQATGGPCKYTGRDMKTAHSGANVTETEWQAFAENLGKTFDRFNVPVRERSDLLQLIGPMKADIVGH